MTTTFLNEEPFEHISHNGIKFTSDRCDFKSQVIAEVPSGLSTEEMMGDVAEMIAYHVLNIFPQLNGFQGYDCISFNSVGKSK